MEEFEVSESATKTKTIYISTVFGISMVLLMVGLLGLILVHANNLSRYVKENIVLNIFVDEAAHEADVRQLQTQLDANPAVKQAIYVSKELAARNAALETKVAEQQRTLQTQQASTTDFEQRLRALEAGGARAEAGK